jgi:hypothetical protein
LIIKRLLFALQKLSVLLTPRVPSKRETAKASNWIKHNLSENRSHEQFEKLLCSRTVDFLDEQHYSTTPNGIPSIPLISRQDNNDRHHNQTTCLLRETARTDTTGISMATRKRLSLSNKRKKIGTQCIVGNIDWTIADGNVTNIYTCVRGNKFHSGLHSTTH